jgi:hypothetical protein
MPNTHCWVAKRSVLLWEVVEQIEVQEDGDGGGGGGGGGGDDGDKGI